MDEERVLEAEAVLAFLKRLDLDRLALSRPLWKDAVYAPDSTWIG